MLGTSVLTPTMRYHPAIVAQAFATLGCLGPGRIFLGVGTGEAMNETPITGGEFPGRKERRLKMAEAIKVIKLLWSEERVDFEGDYYKLRRATIYDRPEQPVPIYVAASGPLAAKLAGRVGDGFICTSGKDPQLYVDLLANVKEGAEKAGRDYESIKRMIEVKVSYDRDPERRREGHALVGRAGAHARGEGGRRGPGRDGAPGRQRARPRAHALHRLRRPAGDRGQDPALHRPRLHRAGLPLPRQRPAALHRRVRRRRLPAPAMTLRDPRRALRAAASRPTARLDHLYDGCRWAEGPAYFPAHRALVWSDIPNDRMLRYDEATGNVGEFRSPAGYTNGHTVDPQGRLVSCEHGNRRVTRTEHDGTITVLADAFEGKRLNSPNDVVVRSRRHGLLQRPRLRHRGWYEGYKAEREHGGCYVFRIDPITGALSVVADDFDHPNGLAFSLDERAALRQRHRAPRTCACSTSPTTAR